MEAAVGMPPEPPKDLTRLLHDWASGDAQALPQLMDAVYPELHRIAARRLSQERKGHTLQPTAHVSEAYLRLARQPAGKQWQDRTHFFAVAARVVRAVLVDHARARMSVKRGGGAISVELSEAVAPVPTPPVDLIDLNDALDALEAIDPQKSRVVELRYFGGLSIDETAEVLAMSASSVDRDWLLAKTWIRRHMTRPATSA